jgi:hypothetical protein
VQRKKRSNNAAIGILTRETDCSFTVAAQYRDFTELPQLQLQQLTMDGGVRHWRHYFSSESIALTDLLDEWI